MQDIWSVTWTAFTAEKKSETERRSVEKYGSRHNMLLSTCMHEIFSNLDTFISGVTDTCSCA
jgi:hypothetical protein